MIKFVKVAINILKVENEKELSYLIGQKKIKVKKKSSIKSIIREKLSLIDLRFGIWDSKNYYGIDEKKSVEYLIYAGTKNQLDSLSEFVYSLKRKKKFFRAFTPQKKVRTDNASFEDFCLSIGDALCSLMVLSVRGISVYNTQSNNSCKIKLVSDFYTYMCLIVFIKMLSGLRPAFVVVSNDHNRDTRCLIAVAHYLGIKTVYMQHASVSYKFPALRFDYAFLDGKKSLNVYKKCEANSPSHIIEYPKPIIFLSGQKKKLFLCDKVRQNNMVGVAFNLNDSIDKVVDLVDDLLQAGINVSLRWHPRQDEKSVDEIKKKYEENSSVYLSDSLSEHVSGFLRNCDVLVCGNSSIHLEAALMGLYTVYYQLSGDGLFDYYGYVKEGVSVSVNSISELIDLIKHKSKREKNMRDKAIKFYSETYNTKWMGCEGDLVAETLSRIYDKNCINDLYEERVDNFFEDVYSLK